MIAIMNENLFNGKVCKKVQYFVNKEQIDYLIMSEQNQLDDDRWHLQGLKYIDTLQYSVIDTITMILDKYKQRRKLGKGAYGQVLLVQTNKGQQFALKLITMKSLMKESYLLDYLEGQIDCMKTLNSPYIMKLYDTEEDENYKYLVCEYCDGGDLLNFQAKQPGKVFTLEKATEILAQVIKGLYDLHEAGYLHRDIKSQNILIKTDNHKQTFKLADFGFSKKSTQVGGTVLGTQNYMSPEIYKNQTYGFEVDMWAFGVLFYFMLNMEFPFKINPHAALQKKEADLKNAAKDFSYKKLVEQSKKKIMGNCTNEVEDLFKKIFNPNADDRITFSKIREHPLFAKYFPVAHPPSKVLYSKKFQSKVAYKANKMANTKHPKAQEEDNVRMTYSIIRPKDKKFPKEKSTLQTKKDQIDFLMENALQFYENTDYFRTEERYSLTFNLIKYYVVLLREFIENLNPAKLNGLYPNMAWNDFCKTNEFKDIKKEAEDDKAKYEHMFDELYGQCSFCIKEIDVINSKFQGAYDKQITQTAFEGAFKESYRKSTHTAFNTLRNLIKSSGKSGNKLNYNLAILVISHVFNHIFSDGENVKKIFEEYLKEKGRSVETMDYSELREWMTRASPGQLNMLAKQIIQLYFA